MRVLFYIEKPTFSEFFESFHDHFDLLSHTFMLKNLLYLLLIANCNFRQNSSLNTFGSFLKKISKQNENNKLLFLKSLSPALEKYSLSLKELSEDETACECLSCLNNSTFHFLTPELLTSIYLNNVCQINITALLAEPNILNEGLDFFYESFTIIKDESLKNKILSFLTFLFEKNEFLRKMFEEVEPMRNILFRGFREDNEINYSFRNNFFQVIKQFLGNLKNQIGGHKDYEIKIIRFFCIFFQKLVIFNESINCIEIFKLLQNSHFSEDLSNEKVTYYL